MGIRQEEEYAHKNNPRTRHNRMSSFMNRIRSVRQSFRKRRMPMEREGSQVVLLSNGCWAEDAFDSSEENDGGDENTDYKVHLSRDDIEEPIDEEEYASDSDSDSTDGSDASDHKEADTKDCDNDHEVSPTPSQLTASTVASSMISTPPQQKSPHRHRHQSSSRTRLSENDLTNHCRPKMIDDDDDDNSGTEEKVSEEQLLILADDETWCPLKDKDIASSVVPEQTSASTKTKKMSTRRIQSQQQRSRNSNSNARKKKEKKVRRGRREEHVKESLKSNISNHREQKKTKNEKKKPEATSALSSKEDEKDQQLNSSDRNLFDMSNNNNNTSHTNAKKIDLSPTQPIRRKSLGLVPTVAAVNIDSTTTTSEIMKQKSVSSS